MCLWLIINYDHKIVEISIYLYYLISEPPAIGFIIYFLKAESASSDS